MKFFSQLFLWICILFFQNIFSQSTVYVQTNQFGRGFLKMRGSECFVVTPNHLLKNYNGPISIYGEGRQRARADLFKTYVGDLALLEFSEEHNQNCTKWQLNKNYNTIVNNIHKGYLELRNKDGSATKVSVKITDIDVQYITIEPEDVKDKFYQGMSGSTLFVEYQGQKVFLGMLQSISSDGIGYGEVIRADEMDKLLESFFNPITQQKKSNVITDKDLTKEVSDFRFELLDIEKSGNRVTFIMDVTSLNNDKELHLDNRNIFLYENNGLEYKPTNITLGNHSYWTVDYNLIKDTPVPLKITFNEIASTAKFATSFKVGFSSNKIASNFNFNDLYFGDESEDFSTVVKEKGHWSEETLDFKFDLLSVEKLNSDVVLTFTVTSLNLDKLIKINTRNIFLYDNNGFEFKSNNIIIANKSYWSVEYNLIKNIAVPLIISFKEIPATTSSISKLKIGFSDKQNQGSFAIENVPFMVKSSENNTSNTSNTNETTNSSACSEIYFYRKNGFLECEETVYLYNHGELLAKLQPGTRYKSTVCDDRSFKFSVRTNPNEMALSSNRPQIELGTNYYFKISCAVGVSTITQQEPAKGKKEIGNNSKFKRKLQALPLTEY
ncbi:hypothetical protein ACFQ5N_09040 [Lutibacter holmesii]|uniref:Serine protease n=1 Tax=Lutibacter holmesii TaxID=1137985 RepID=A0ABW3WP22_9FLAO